MGDFGHLAGNVMLNPPSYPARQRNNTVRSVATWQLETNAMRICRLSSNLDGLSSNPPALSSNPHWQALPPDLKELVLALGQRATPDKLRETIIRLCRHQPWQAAELGGLFGRNPVYLGTQYLRPLVSVGVLAYTMPEVPNHPHQAYRAVDSVELAE